MPLHPFTRNSQPKQPPPPPNPPSTSPPWAPSSPPCVHALTAASQSYTSPTKTCPRASTSRGASTSTLRLSNGTTPPLRPARSRQLSRRMRCRRRHTRLRRRDVRMDRVEGLVGRGAWMRWLWEVVGGGSGRAGRRGRVGVGRDMRGVDGCVGCGVFGV
jgi:hypothetical protein